MTHRILRPAIFGCVLVSEPLLAQGASDRTVTGIVTDSVSSRVVRGAVVYFDGQRTEILAGRDGRFTIEHVPAGDTVLIIRGIGYVPTQLVVPYSASAAVVDLGRVTLRPVATRLDQIAVEAEAVKRFPHLDDFYRRKQTGRAGDFFTSDDVERSRVRRTSEFLQRSAKLEMDCPRDPVKSGHDGCIARDRRGLSYKVTQGDKARCEKEVFVDGMQSLLAVDEIPVHEVAAIEIYAGPATTPANFGQRRCGVIAIWTKGARR